MIHLIVPVHNRASVTSQFLDALVNQTVSEYRLLLVDDGCTDGTAVIARLKIAAAKLVVLTGDGQLWWAGALQMAYEHLTEHGFAPGDAVLIVNDDVTFDSEFLADGLKVLAEHPGACIQAIGIDRESGNVDRGAVADLVRLKFRAADHGEAPNCLSTRGLLMGAPTFARSGGFRPRWLPHYLSDYEFTLRLQRTGAPLIVDERFSATVALNLTGIDKPTSRGMRRYWSDSFSNRAKFNPKHWSAFVLMACPVWVSPWHLARIWLRFARLMLTSTWRRAGHAC